MNTKKSIQMLEVGKKFLSKLVSGSYLSVLGYRHLRISNKRFKTFPQKNTSHVDEFLLTIAVDLQTTQRAHRVHSKSCYSVLSDKHDKL